MSGVTLYIAVDNSFIMCCRFFAAAAGYRSAVIVAFLEKNRLRPRAAFVFIVKQITVFRPV